MGKVLINTIYMKPSWNSFIGPSGRREFEKLADDCIIMLIKDTDTGKSEIKIIERPTIDYYVSKDRNRAYPEISLPLDQVEKRTVEYSKLAINLAKEVGLLNEYKSIKSTYGDRSSEMYNFVQKEFNNSPILYSVDMDIEDYYKTKFMTEHGTVIANDLNISYFDIETYIYGLKEKFTENNPTSPINLISYINGKKKELFGLVLRIGDVKTFDELKTDCKDLLDEIYKEYEDKNPDMKISLEYYTSEELLISRLFQLIHQDKPEICFAWNSHFDLKYLIGRAKILNMDVNELFCHPDIPQKYRKVWYKEEKERRSDIPSKEKTKHFSRYWDWLRAPGYTVYLDQMSVYSNLRKRSLKPTYKLNAIALEEVGFEKVALRDFGLTIRNAPFKDLKRFIKYSLRDTYLLMKIEEKVNDAPMLLLTSSNTKLENAVNVSCIIKNAFYANYIENGEVIGNTVDYFIRESIEGAIVASPYLYDIVGMNIDGVYTDIHQHIVDFDAASEYPSIMIAFNIGKNTIFGKITVVRDKDTGKYLTDGATINQALQTIETSCISLVSALFGVPNVEEMLSSIEYYLDKV